MVPRTALRLRTGELDMDLAPIARRDFGRSFVPKNWQSANEPIESGAISEFLTFAVSLHHSRRCKGSARQVSEVLVGAA